MSAGVGWMHADIGQSWHTAGVNITPDRTRVALVGQWIPMYFRGDTELHDLDTRASPSAANLVLRTVEECQLLWLPAAFHPH